MNNIALVLKTGEILDVVTSLHEVKYEIDINIESGKIDFSEISDSLVEYVLSDGKKYEGSDVIRGLDNIRDWKIQKIKNSDCG